MSNLYFAKVPVRNTYLSLCNRLAAKRDTSSIFRLYDVDVVLDVGANNGQYGRSLIKKGFQGRIISFEPLPTAICKLRMNRWGFKHWTVESFGLSNYDGTANLNISQNSQSSSIHGILDSHVSAAPSSAYVDSVEVQVHRLDTVFSKYVGATERCYLKLDVQGHELSVLEGAAGCLDRITAIQMEVSLTSLYADAPTWLEAIDRVELLGFRLLQLQPGFGDARTGEMLQADAIFVRQQAIERLRAA